jgi:hypothetical protein
MSTGPNIEVLPSGTEVYLLQHKVLRRIAEQSSGHPIADILVAHNLQKVSPFLKEIPKAIRQWWVWLIFERFFILPIMIWAVGLFLVLPLGPALGGWWWWVSICAGIGFGVITTLVLALRFTSFMAKGMLFSLRTPLLFFYLDRVYEFNPDRDALLEDTARLDKYILELSESIETLNTITQHGDLKAEVEDMLSIRKRWYEKAQTLKAEFQMAKTRMDEQRQSVHVYFETSRLRNLISEHQNQTEAMRMKMAELKIQQMDLHHQSELIHEEWVEMGRQLASISTVERL